MTGYRIARLDEIDEIDDGQRPFRAVRQHLGISTFGITAMTAHADGDLLIPEHDETYSHSSEELYVVVSGYASFEVDGEMQDAPAGTFVAVPAGIKRAAVARDAGTTVLAISGGAEGKPYELSRWEAFAPLFPLFESGEYEQGADRAQALLADDPSYGASVYYNTACFESRAGRIDAAIGHLRRAVELAPSMAELARDDEDFAALRENPAFGKIVDD
jgi:mannose-6-phosphate isomerase-like protein (cupin superfamily)